jgi:hypothetical protein
MDGLPACACCHFPCTIAPLVVFFSCMHYLLEYYSTAICIPCPNAGARSQLGCARLGAEQRQVGDKQGFVHLKCSSATIKATGIHLTLCDECEAGPVGVLISLLGSMRVTIPWYVTCLWADWYTKVISTRKRKLKKGKGANGVCLGLVYARSSAKDGNLLLLLLLLFALCKVAP